MEVIEKKIFKIDSSMIKELIIKKYNEFKQ